MSVGFIGAKHTVFDIYPIRKKRIFVLVDPECIIECDFYSTVASIHYLAQKGASVIVASSFGSLAGVKLGTRREEDALKTFAEEGGLGYTNCFAALPSNKKVEILQSIPSVHLEPDFSAAKKGKTKMFASLRNEEKQRALKKFFPLQEFTTSTTRSFVTILQKCMPEVNVSFSDTFRLKRDVEPGEVIVLENLRFYKNERSLEVVERQAFADALATGLGVDLYVNDSFATSHLIQASTVELPKRLQHGAAGGINIPKKLRLIYTLVEKVDRIFVGGRIAFPFIVARGLSCGQSYLMEEEQMVAMPSNAKVEYIPCSELAKKIIEKCERAHVDIIAPRDFLVTRDPDASPETAITVDASSVPDDCYIMDIGNSSVHMFLRCLRSCRTVVWTGVFGWTSKGYSGRTSDFATSIIHTETSVIVGGRCTARLIQTRNLMSDGLHVSPGGLPCLEILEGNILPGVEALSDVAADAVDFHSSVSADGLIRKLPLFIGCNSHQMKAIARKFVRRVHGKGDYIFHRGDKVVRLCVLAQGALIAKGGADFDSSPSRYIPKEHTVGMYEFISQAPAPETVRVAQNDTVTYQLSSSSLNELLNAYPELAIQLLQNLSKQLRIIAAEDYSKQQSILNTTRRMGYVTRVPQPAVTITRNGMWEDILQDLVATTLFQRLAMAYTPYTPCSDEFKMELTKGPSFLKQLQPIYLYQGLPYSLAQSVAKNVLYHHLISWTHQPFVASVLSAITTSPLRLLAYGIPYTEFNFNLILEEAMYSATLSVAPFAAFALFLKAQQRLELYFRRRLHAGSQLILMGVIKMLIGNVLFLIVYQRNFVYTPPSASRVWNSNAFQAYQAKQALAVLVRLLVHHLKVMILSTYIKRKITSHSWNKMVQRILEQIMRFLCLSLFISLASPRLFFCRARFFCAGKRRALRPPLAAGSWRFRADGPREKVAPGAWRAASDGKYPKERGNEVIAEVQLERGALRMIHTGFALLLSHNEILAFIRFPASHPQPIRPRRGPLAQEHKGSQFLGPLKDKARCHLIFCGKIVGPCLDSPRSGHFSRYVWPRRFLEGHTGAVCMSAAVFMPSGPFDFPVWGSIRPKRCAAVLEGGGLHTVNARSILARRILPHARAKKGLQPFLRCHTGVLPGRGAVLPPFPYVFDGPLRGLASRHAPSRRPTKSTRKKNLFLNS
eukprot:gene8407-5888_t